MRAIDEILVSPMKPWVMLAGYVSGGVARGLIVGAAVFIVSVIFAHPQVTHAFALVYFLLMTCIIFSLLGFLNGLFARTFDEIGIVPTFILTPLTYLGGVFYSLDLLPPFWRTLSMANPIVYMIDGFRYGFSGIAETSVWVSALVLLLVAGALWWANLTLVRRGTGLLQ
jgi:ABC-2 type transport system permease protein